MYQRISILFYLSLCSFMGVMGSSLLGETQEESSKVFLQVQPLPVYASAGYAKDNHGIGLVVARDLGGINYTAFGVDYVYFLRGVSNTGWYLKLLYEFRRYDAGLKANYRTNDDSRTWEYDVLNNHRAHHAGALLGFRKIISDSGFFIQLGLGWQFNSNPINTGNTVFGLGQSVKSKSEAFGELYFGYMF